MRKFVASFVTSEQVAEDSWRPFRKVGIFDRSATLEDVYNWVKPKGMGKTVEDRYVMQGIEISEDSTKENDHARG